MIPKTIACAYVFTPVFHLLAPGGSHYPKISILAQDRPHFGTKGTHVLQRTTFQKLITNTVTYAYAFTFACSWGFTLPQNWYSCPRQATFWAKGTHALQQKQKFQQRYCQNDSMCVCFNTCVSVACFWGFTLPQKFDSGPRHTTIWNKRNTCLTRERKF